MYKAQLCEVSAVQMSYRIKSRVWLKYDLEHLSQPVFLFELSPLETLWTRIKVPAWSVFSERTDTSRQEKTHRVTDVSKENKKRRFHILTNRTKAGVGAAGDKEDSNMDPGSCWDTRADLWCIKHHTVMEEPVRVHLPSLCVFPSHTDWIWLNFNGDELTTICSTGILSSSRTIAVLMRGRILQGRAQTKATLYTFMFQSCVTTEQRRFLQGNLQDTTDSGLNGFCHFWLCRTRLEQQLQHSCGEIIQAFRHEDESCFQNQRADRVGPIKIKAH